MYFSRSYSHMDVLTKASITIQIIEDVAIYKAQIFSSNGNIIAVNDKSTDIHLVVWKGLEDITSKFTDIIWKRFTNNQNKYEEDLTWGEEYKGLTNFTLAKDEIHERAKLQVEVYANINGERKLVAVDSINFIDVNDIQGSTTPPSNPKDGDLWLDTSVVPPRLMMWDASLGQWVEVLIAGNDRRNLIRNSNFYKGTYSHWIFSNYITAYTGKGMLNQVISSKINEDEVIVPLEIESYIAKKWARIKTDGTTKGCYGIKQIVENTKQKSFYTFQVLARTYMFSINPEGDMTVAFYSIDDEGVRTLITEDVYNITSSTKIYTTTFKTFENTKNIEVTIYGDTKKASDFIFTEIKLENYPTATEWELAIEDMQDALNNKTGNTHEEVFNTLTDDGKMQGMYVDIDEHGNKNFYFNATYIKTGKLLGQYIEGKNLTVLNHYGQKTLEITDTGEVNIQASSLKIVANNNIENVATESDIAYKVEIYSTNGTTFTNGNVNTTLVARVYKGIIDVTDEIDASRFSWSKTLANGQVDTAWNNSFGQNVKSVAITKNDIYQKSTFACTIKK